MRRPTLPPAKQALLLAVVVLAVWFNALFADFQFDDWADVVNNPSAKAGSFLERLPDSLRPLLKASYALQDWLHGPWPAGFHAGNLLLHLGATLLVLVLLRRAARLAGHAEPAAGWIAWVATALWALHPALTESVTYVSGRSAGLSGLLLLGAWLLATGPPRFWPLAAAGLLALLAPLARETALVLPFGLLLWQATLGRDEPWRRALLRALPVWGGSLLAALLLLTLPRQGELLAYSLQTRPPLEALRGNVQAIPDILWFWLAPWRISIDPAQPLVWGWSQAPTLIRLAGLAAIPVAVLLRRRRAPLAAFALGWMLLALLPSNSLLWRNDPVALKPLYLAALGPSLLLALALSRLNRWRPARPLGTALAAQLLLLLSLGTVQRNALFADGVALWQDAVAKAPDKGRPWIALGHEYLALGQLEEAEAALRRGLALEPWNPAARAGLELVELQAAARRQSLP